MRVILGAIDATIRDRRNANSMFARPSNVRPGGGWTCNGLSLFSRAMQVDA
jgi:hypothetical protein